MKTNYANFGYIPYGHEIIGNIYHQFDNPLACEPLEERVFDVDMDGDITPFFVAVRGKCTFVQKVRNMQNIGAAVAIIIEDKEENLDEIVMSDDGTGGGIRIPSVLISKTDGEKLLDFLKNANPSELKSISAVI